LVFPVSRKCDNGVNSGKIFSQKCKNRLPKPGSETKLGPGLCDCRRRVRATVCRDKLLLSSFSLPHAYFYGNWMAKVPNILPDERIIGSQQAIVRVGGAVGQGFLREQTAKFQSTCAKGSDTSATRVGAAKFRDA
jgi:hypothetical protein